MIGEIKKIGVIGSGVMGAQLSAIFAGAGAQVELLDIVPPGSALAPAEKSDARFRNRLAVEAIARLAKMKPPPLYSKGDALLIRPGNLEDHIERLKNCGWVIEAVTERADIKKSLYTRLAGVLKDDAILSSNTSSMLRKNLMDGMDPRLSEKFIVTHFFNPPRYMKLLEIVGGAESRPCVDLVSRFAEEKLGKGVVIAKDTPGFIANRIGLFYVLDILHRALENGWPIEAVDAVLGRATGRPRSGIFRTADIAGLDTLSFAAAELVKNCPNDEGIGRLRIPQFLQQMVVNGHTGDKSGRGFYFKDRATGQISAFDMAKQDYRTKVNFATPSLKDAAKIEDAGARMKRVVFAEDQAGEIAWPSIIQTLIYSANRVPEISDDIVSVDNAMRWGYHWELGPFETWDALGVKEVAGRIEKEGGKVPRLVSELLSKGRTKFYEWQGHHRMYFDLNLGKSEIAGGSEKRVPLKRFKEIGRKLDENAGASLIDVGDGVFACEFHTKMNAIDGDVIKMLHASLDRVEKDGSGLLIYNEGEQFSVGANLLLIVMAAGSGRWEEIDTMIREFQSVNQRMRFSPKPVMAVPFGMALGGGCEICLAAPYRMASIETYMGLVEMGAGLIPAGGGCKNLILRMEKHAKTGGPGPKVNAAFELIATARVSTSAKEAVQLGLLSKDDSIVMDRELMLTTARAKIIEMVKNYEPPAMRTNICLPGRGGEMALDNALRGFVAQGKATEYDAFIAKKLARVLAGGDFPTVHETTEDHILELEREAFLSLVGEPKTQERMANLLKTGKPLRN